MVYSIQSQFESEALIALLDAVMTYGAQRSARQKNIIELHDVFLSVQFNQKAWDGFVAKEHEIRQIGQGLLNKSLNKMERVYEGDADTLGKPSYKIRVQPFLDAALLRFLKEPDTRALVFSTLNPKDLSAEKRASYVPCLSSGQFVRRDGALDFQASFSTHDALMAGWGDLFYLRAMQIGFLESAKAMVRAQDTHKKSYDRVLNTEIGHLNLHFSRVFIDTNKRVRHKDRKDEYVDMRPDIDQLKCKLLEIG